MPEFIRNPLAPKNKPVDNPAFSRQWRREHRWCMVCGREPDVPSVHHIIGGRGGRSDEAANFLLACWYPCHMVIEGHRISVNGALLPPLPLGVVLSMKARSGELSDADLARLQVLHGRRLPDLLPIPVEFDRAYRLNRPEGK